MIDTGGLDRLTDAELVARIEEAAALEGGWYEAEQLGQAIARLGERGVRLLESLVDHTSGDVAAGSVHGLQQVEGWSLRNTEMLRRLIFEPRPDVASMALGAAYGESAGRKVCHIPEIADRVAHEFARHESSNLRSSAISYLAVCAPGRHFDTLLGGLSDSHAYVRWSTVNDLSGLDEPDLLRRATPHLWRRPDDEDLVVRDWTQLAIESNVWPPDEGRSPMPLTQDAELLAYSRTRVDLGPRHGWSNDVPDLGAIADALKGERPMAVRRGAADELEEWLESTSDPRVISKMIELGRRFVDDPDHRVRQAMTELMERAEQRV